MQQFRDLVQKPNTMAVQPKARKALKRKPKPLARNLSNGGGRNRVRDLANQSPDQSKLRDVLSRAFALLGMTFPANCPDAQLVDVAASLLSVIEAGNDPGDSTSSGASGSGALGGEDGMSQFLSNSVSRHIRDMQNEHQRKVIDAVRRGQRIPKPRLTAAQLRQGVDALAGGFHRR